MKRIIRVFYFLKDTYVRRARILEPCCGCFKCHTLALQAFRTSEMKDYKVTTYM